MSASLARDFHIEPRWVEDRSRDTFQNAQFSARMLKAAGVSRIILVTDAAHEWRAVHEFTSAGLAVVPAPDGHVAVARPRPAAATCRTPTRCSTPAPRSTSFSATSRDGRWPRSTCAGRRRERAARALRYQRGPARS